MRYERERTDAERRAAAERDELFVRALAELAGEPDCAMTGIIPTWKQIREAAARLLGRGKQKGSAS